WGLPVPLMVVGAMFSKGPGVLHAVMMLGAVAAALITKEHWRSVRRHWKPWLGVLALLILGGVLFSHELAWAVGRLSKRWEGNLLMWHAVTMCRVFWQFVVLFFNPADLSADHLIGETKSWKDVAAVWSVVGVALWTLFSVCLFFGRKPRPLGACLLLTVGAILLRFLYYINEFMPEYRIYPGLPWMSLAVAALGWMLWSALRFGVRPAGLVAALVLVSCLFSAQRSFLWHDLDRLMADVLEQYPGQSRAMWVLQRRDIDERNWDAVIERQRSEWPAVVEAFRKEYLAWKGVRFYSTGHFALADVAMHGMYARALSGKYGPAIGSAEIDRLEVKMKKLEIEQDLHWSLFRHAKALILEDAGRFDEALAILEEESKGTNFHGDYLRVKSKVEAANGAKGG
ncbi:MAG: hypothetical protein AAGJ79_08315, partial [Verrucomicrobiota bacterium]